MTTVVPEGGNKTVKMKQKQTINDHHQHPHQQAKEETRSFLSFSRENLSISNSDLEQGFNKHRFRPSRHTILSTVGLLIALLCLGLETWELRMSLANARNIEILQWEVDRLKHRVVEKDLLDELKIFEQQLYAHPSSDEDPAESDMDNDEYDSNYEDEDISSHEYSEDYQTSPNYGARPSDFPDGTVTSDSVPTPLEPRPNKKFVDILAAVRELEAEHGADFEKKIRENHWDAEPEKLLDEHKKLMEREETLTKKKNNEEEINRGTREVLAKNGRKKRIVDSVPTSWEKNYANWREDFVIRKRSLDEEEELPLPDGTPEPPSTRRKGSRNQIRRTSSSESRTRERSSSKERRSTTEKITATTLASWDRHPPKKYYAHARSEMMRASSEDTSILQEQPIHPRRRGNDEPEAGRGSRKSNRRQELIEEGEMGMSRSVQSNEDVQKQRRRGMIRRHARVLPRAYAVHYVGDTRMNMPHEHNHTGNGKVQHVNSNFTAWKPSEWVGNLGMNQYFTLANGILTVHQSGLYLVYAQIHYIDQHDENAFHILVNGRSILQCMDYSPGPRSKSRSCFSAQVTVLREGDNLVLKDVGSSRWVLFQNDKSFFGLVKLGETGQQAEASIKPF